MSRPTWFVQFIKKIFPTRFFVARATNVPPLDRFFDHWLFEDDDMICLPKDDVVRKIEVDQAIDPPDEMVLPSKVVEYFIEQASVHWVMDFCLCRFSNQCQDYPIELGCLFLGEAALEINPELGRRVTKEEALEHVRRCREAGLVHFIGRNKLDTVWLGVGPGERLLTICNCCPCCCLWGILPEVTPRISDKITRMPGVTVTVSDRCVGCGACTRDVCFVDAIQVVDGRAVISDACRGCGRCVDVCPEGAIEMSIEVGDFVERSIDRISPLVDVS